MEKYIKYKTDNKLKCIKRKIYFLKIKNEI